MFRLLKHKTDQKPQDRFEFKFKFSNLQAFQVPKGWDKLFVSIVSMETGKSITKSGKTLVHNGNCWWEETFIESVWISQNGASKDIQQCLFKLVVAMGSIRFGTLGEATVNLASYMTSKPCPPLSIPLKKCDHGTTLQLKIQCLTPRTKLRDEQWEDSNSYMEEMNVDYDDIDNKSDVSDNAFTRSARSSSSNHWENTNHLGELCRETSFLASSSRRSFGSIEDSLRREKSSPRDKSRGIMNDLTGRKDSNGTNISTDHPRPNSSTFSSKVSGSGSHSRKQREENSEQVSSSTSLSLQKTASSKDLLDAAEATIELLKAEANMWEQNTRKLMIDLEKLRKELSGQSKRRASLEVELFELYMECDNMKQEAGQLNIRSDEARAKQMDDTHKELENELKFQKESIVNFSIQLKKSIEANSELVSLLQELEGTIEKQKTEINILTMAKSQFEELQRKQFQDQENLESKIHFLEKTLVENNREWSSKLAEKEEEIINSEVKCHDAYDLRQKVQKLETDCLQLAKENSKLQHELDDLPRTSECEVSKLKSQVCELEEELKKNNTLIKEKQVSATDLRSQYCTNLESKCAGLEHELRAFEDKACCLDDELCKVHDQSKKQENHIAALQKKLECYREKETEGKKDFIPSLCTNSEISYSAAATEMYGLFHKLYEQLQLSIENTKNQKLTAFEGKIASEGSVVPGGTDYLITQEGEADDILNSLIQMKRLFEATITLCGEELHCSEEEVISLVENTNIVQNKLCSSSEEINFLHIELEESESTEVNEEVWNEASETKTLPDEKIPRDKEEIKDLRQCQRELEPWIAYPHEGSMECSSNGEDDSCKCLADLQNDLVVFDNSMYSTTSTDQTLAEKSMEMESNQYEMEGHLSELQEENVLLSERICGLEAVLRYMTDERESSRLALQNSESHAMNLQDEIGRMGNEMEERKADMKQKLKDMTKQWLEAHGECEFLKIDNLKVEAATQSLVEEQSLLQKSNGELRKQNMELEELCAVSEAELRESQKYFADMLKEMEDLDAKSSSMHEGITSKEKAISSELDGFLLESKHFKEKLALEESQLNKMHLEETIEVDNLQREVANISTKLISATHDEKAKTGSESVLEAYCLNADRTLLEAAVKEIQGKVKLYETKLDLLHVESEVKVVWLLSQLAASKQNQEILMVDHEKVLKMLEDVKSNEEKLENTVTRLELKLKATEYEKQKLAEEISCLKVQMQKVEVFQDQVLALKRALCAAQSEKQRLETSFQILYGDHEELKTKRISYVVKISSMEKSMSELEACRRSKAVLEEKVVQLEWDLTAREALRPKVGELKNELARVKRTNSEFRTRIRCLEEEKAECLKKSQALEEELRQKMLELRQDQMEIDQAQQISDGQGKSDIDEHQEQVDKKQHCETGNSQAIGTDSLSKIKVLESELAEALNANDRYKSQLESLLSEGIIALSDHAPEELKGKDETVNGEEHEQKVTLLEKELRDIRERYFDISLKYAELEADREQLARKLKNKEKKWF